MVPQAIAGPIDLIRVLRSAEIPKRVVPHGLPREGISRPLTSEEVIAIVPSDTTSEGVQLKAILEFVVHRPYASPKIAATDLETLLSEIRRRAGPGWDFDKRVWPNDELAFVGTVGAAVTINTRTGVIRRGTVQARGFQNGERVWATELLNPRVLSLSAQESSAPLKEALTNVNPTSGALRGAR